MPGWTMPMISETNGFRWRAANRFVPTAKVVMRDVERRRRPR
jgi:hypothetical protein